MRLEPLVYLCSLQFKIGGANCSLKIRVPSVILFKIRWVAVFSDLARTIELRVAFVFKSPSRWRAEVQSKKLAAGVHSRIVVEKDKERVRGDFILCVLCALCG